MASIQETAYPRLKLPLSRKVLRDSFTPTSQEIQFAQKHCRQIWAQICLLSFLKTYQHLGYFLMWKQIPEPVISSAAQSLGYLFLPDDIPDNYDQSGNKYRHIRLIRKYLQVKPISSQTYSSLQTVARKAALTKEYLVDIINVMIEELIKQRFELPAFSRFTRLAGAARQEVNRQFCEQISEALTDDQKQLIDQLLDLRDDQGQSWWQKMKKDPPAPTVKNTRIYIQHVEAIQQYYNRLQVRIDLPSAKRKQFFYEAYAADLAHLRKFNTSKRYAFVVLLLEWQMSKALDDIAHMFMRRVRKLHNIAQAKLDQYRQQSRHQVALLLEHLARITTAYQFPGSPIQRFEAIAAVMPSDPEGVAEQCYHHMAYAEDNYRLCMLPIYKGKRTVLFDCVSALALSSSSQDQTMIKAIAFVLNHGNSRKEWIPVLDNQTGELLLDLDWIVDGWRKLVTGKKSKEATITQVHRKNFELCVFSELHRQLNSGDIYIQGSNEFKDYRVQQVSWQQYEELISGYESLSGIPTDEDAFIQKVKTELKQVAKQVDASFPTNRNARIEKGEIILPRPAKKKSPKDYPLLNHLLKERITPLNILEMLIHTEKWLHLSKQFHTLSGKGSKISDYPKRLISTLFCYGCFLGPTQTARSVRGIDRKQLAWINSHHITEERLNRAITKVINTYHRFSLPKYWGSGKSVSADGTQWEMYEQNLMAQYHIRYGGYGGVSYYHVSDTYIALFSHFIPCGVREAVYILDGLFKNQSDIRPDTVHGDTHSQNTVAFGLAYLLGIKLMPRIKNIKDLSLFRPQKGMSFEHIDALFSDSINWRLIQTHLPDMLRVVLSIMEGKISPSTILKRLGSHSRKNKLYFAFRELGRAVRTQFLLQYIHDIELRRTISAATNKSEEFNQFADWIAFASKVIPENLRHEQTKVIKYNHLVANLLILYNVDEMTRVFNELIEEGYTIDKEVLQAFAPYRTEHINRFGSYILDMDRPVKPFNHRINLT